MGEKDSETIQVKPEEMIAIGDSRVTSNYFDGGLSIAFNSSCGDLDQMQASVFRVRILRTSYRDSLFNKTDAEHGRGHEEMAWELDFMRWADDGGAHPSWIKSCPG